MRPATALVADGRLRMNISLAIWSAVAALLAMAGQSAVAHGPVPRKAENVPTEARLFTADSATGAVVVVDLPSGQVVTRIPTPPFVLTMGRSQDGRYIFAMRGRDSDRDTITVIDSGIDRAAGKMLLPVVARTWLGRSPGGVHDGVLSSVGGRDAIFQEDVGELQVFDGNDFGSLNGVPSRLIKLAAPDHYHYLEAGNFLYVGHLAKSMVQILERDTGQEVGRVQKCPILHGMAADEPSGRLFFACMKDVVVVGTRSGEQNREVARIPYPSAQRIGIFVHGRDRVIWGTTEGANPAVLKLDAAREPYAFEAVPVDSVIQRGATEDGSLLLLYSRTGKLDIRDGGSGRLLRQVAISKPFSKEYHEHVDKALLPDIITRGTTGLISIPPEGVIVEVDLVKGRVMRRIAVGGEPTRLIAVEARASANPQTSAGATASATRAIESAGSP